MDYLSHLDPLLQTFWYIAIPASIIFSIQTILTFIGGADLDVEADFDTDGGEHSTSIFSFRNLINFLLGFSWTGISFYSTISNHTFLIGLSLLVGIVFVYFFFLIINQVQKLAEDNSFKFKDAIGKTAEVYLTIPANRTGTGKVLVSVKGATHELVAFTNGDELPSGSTVKVESIENNNVLIVNKF